MTYQLNQTVTNSSAVGSFITMMNVKIETLGQAHLGVVKLVMETSHSRAMGYLLIIVLRSCYPYPDGTK